MYRDPFRLWTRSDNTHRLQRSVSGTSASSPFQVHPESSTSPGVSEQSATPSDTAHRLPLLRLPHGLPEEIRYMAFASPHPDSILHFLPYRRSAYRFSSNPHKPSLPCLPESVYETPMDCQSALLLLLSQFLSETDSDYRCPS